MTDKMTRDEVLAVCPHGIRHPHECGECLADLRASCGWITARGQFYRSMRAMPSHEHENAVPVYTEAAARERFGKQSIAVSALFDEVEAIRRAAETVDAEDFDDDAIMDIADGIEGEFEGESTELFYSFTPGQLRVFFNRMLLARAKGG